jgi:hypothetical protein
VQRPLSEIKAAESLDLFAWAKVPAPAEHWCRYEWVKALALQKIAIWQMSNERLALAIASLNEANDLWPTLSFAVMGACSPHAG